MYDNSRLARFRERVLDLCNQADPYGSERHPTEKDLAEAIGVARTNLSRYLSGSRPITPPRIRAIVRTLAEWGAIKTEVAARELLQLLDCPDFTAAEWQSPPLDELEKANPDNREPKAQPSQPAAPTWQGDRRATAEPPQPRTLVGRAEDLSGLELLLERNACVVISGVGGIGKTTLASLYYHKHERLTAYAGLHWFALETGPLIADVVREFLASVGEPDNLSGQSPDSQADELLKWLRRNRSAKHLLVLNNCDTIMSALDNRFVANGFEHLLSGLLDDAGGATVLFTSRYLPRAVHGHTPSELPLGGLKQADGAKLLQSEGVADTTERLEQASAKAGGHPLALILLAQLVRIGYTLEHLLATERLWQGEIAMNLLDEVYAKVPLREQQLLQFISVFGGKEIGVADVLGMIKQLPRHSTSWSREVVDRSALALRVKSLLIIHNDLYILHPIVQSYAYSMLKSRQQHHRAAAAHFQAQYIANHPDPHTQPAKNSAEVQPLLDAFDQLCAAGEYQQAADLLYTPLEYLSGGDPVSLKQLLRRWSEFSRLQTMLERLLNAPAALEDSSRAKAMKDLGDVYFSLSENDKAIEYHTRSLELAQQLGDRLLLAQNLNNLGNVYDMVGEYDKAIEFFTRSLELKQQLDDRLGQVISLSNIGGLYHELGEYGKAVEYQTRSLELAQQIGDHGGQARSLHNLGRMYRALGEYDKVIEYSTRSLELAQQLGDRLGQAYNLDILGLVYHTLGEYDKAMDYHTRSLELGQQIGSGEVYALSLGNLGSVYHALGEYDKAIEYLTRSLELAQQIGDSRVQATSLGNLGLVFHTLGEYDKAIEYNARSLELVRKLGDRPAQADSLRNLGSVYQALGDGDTAAGSRAGNNVGDVCIALKRYRAALSYYLKALSIYERLGNPHNIADIRRRISEVRACVGKQDWPALEAEAQREAADPDWQPPQLEAEG